ncbi:hypothetical protein ACFL12_00080 [Pseudomonadota bacterium]
MPAQTNAVEPRFYSRKQLSIISGYSIPTLSAMANAKPQRGPLCIHLKGGGDPRYPIDEAEAWLRGEGGAGVPSRRGGARKKPAQKSKPGRKSNAQKKANDQRIDKKIAEREANQDNVPGEGGAS